MVVDTMNVRNQKKTIGKNLFRLKNKSYWNTWLAEYTHKGPGCRSGCSGRMCCLSAQEQPK